jgi:hypothetical protein
MHFCIELRYLQGGMVQKRDAHLLYHCPSIYTGILIIGNITVVIKQTKHSISASVMSYVSF